MLYSADELGMLSGGVEEAFLYSEETYLIRGGLFVVQNEVGLGRKEEVYHQAFKVWLEKRGIPFASKAPHPIALGGETAHILYHLFNIHRVQSFMKHLRLPFGLAVNYGKSKLHLKALSHPPTISGPSEGISGTSP
ncbi:MAG: GxxExxY protein [Kiritimatiellia bacterium]